MADDDVKGQVKRSRCHDQDEDHSQREQDPTPLEVFKPPACIQIMHEWNAHEKLEEGKFDNTSCEVQSVHQDNHVIDDHDVTRHVFGNHEVCQGHGDETDRDEIKSEFFQRNKWARMRTNNQQQSRERRTNV